MLTGNLEQILSELEAAGVSAHDREQRLRNTLGRIASIVAPVIAFPELQSFRSLEGCLKKVYALAKES